MHTKIPANKSSRPFWTLLTAFLILCNSGSGGSLEVSNFRAVLTRVRSEKIDGALGEYRINPVFIVSFEIPLEVSPDQSINIRIPIRVLNNTFGVTASGISDFYIRDSAGNEVKIYQPEPMASNAVLEIYPNVSVECRLAECLRGAFEKGKIYFISFHVIFKNTNGVVVRALVSGDFKVATLEAQTKDGGL